MIRVIKEHDVRKKEILDTAENLFGENGYDQTSIQSIIDHIGIAKGTFYHYFSSKNALLDGVIDRIIGEIRGILDRMINRDELGPIEKIASISGSLASVGKGREKLMEYIHEERNAHIHLKIEKRVTPLITPYMEGIIEEGNESGVFDVEYPGETAKALLGVYDALFEGRHEGSGRRPPEISLVKAAYDINERILGAKPGIFMEHYKEIISKMGVKD